MSRQQNLEVGTLRADRVEVVSGNGLHRLTLVGMPDGVGVYVDNEETGDGFAVVSEDGRMDATVYGQRPGGTERQPASVSLTCPDGRPAVRLVTQDGKETEVTAEPVSHDEVCGQDIEVSVRLGGSFPAEFVADVCEAVKASVDAVLEDWAGRLAGGDVPEVDDDGPTAA